MQNCSRVLTKCGTTEEEGLARDEGKITPIRGPDYRGLLLSLPFLQQRGEDPVKGSRRKYLDFIDILLEARVSACPTPVVMLMMMS